MLSALSWKGVHADIRHRIQRSCAPRSCSMRPRGWATTRSPHAWTPRDRWYPSGANASTSSACPDLPISPGEDDPPVFPPDVVVAVKALACFFFNDTATTEIYTLSLHDALPISPGDLPSRTGASIQRLAKNSPARSEEHTSELQSRQYLVCRLLLEKKKKKK